MHDTGTLLARESTSKVAPRSRRLDIDGLRFVAAAAVVANHLNERLLPGGFLGVDCFYVISGYVVTLSVALQHRQQQSSCLRSGLSFYARRIRRLVPLNVVVVAVTTLAISALLSRYNESVADVIYTSGLTSLVGWTNNYLVIREIKHGDGGYWGLGRASATWNPFTHCWSLGVEEQFYLLFPLFYTPLKTSETSKDGGARGERGWEGGSWERGGVDEINAKFT